MHTRRFISLMPRAPAVLLVAFVLVFPTGAYADPFEYKIETGAFGGWIGMGGTSPLPNYMLLYNHFELVSPYDVITDLKVAWDGIYREVDAVVAIWSDPNGDGSDAQLLMSQDVVVTERGWATYDIPDTAVTGSFFVGVAFKDSQAGVLAGTPLGPSYQSFWGLTPSVGVLQGSSFEGAWTSHLGIRAEATSAVPEPASLLLLGTGLVGLRVLRKRRQ